MLTVSDRLPEHGLAACVSLAANNASRTIGHTSHEGTWCVVFVGPMVFTSISPTEIADETPAAGV
ncbi:hypothetical protein [Micromonospora saelicesensis]|uniref:Peroxiredoxin n=1 Tax=Micromonospora saelicesensis TaxID=285676 RepID=A0A1C4TWL5_9ACTN|nr:hypothetical protein [Micromonospora saelicesensis]RAN92510.1 Peroxiredoxin [Micromonospora saelicesensis]RAO50609.1 Peroxiredoxin [Micromonospora saelicesensis]RAO57274.1 Peroxiredoxin [Micromonospora saelicesensis]RAO59638.1 Peroxiredoxin [Micromonospora saelicesensis]SCE63833.1 hypothetical protein GA0070561_0414 [Micromonospora saelicesensis]